MSMYVLGSPWSSGPTTQFEGTTWAEEMDLRDPVNEEDAMKFT